jgi:hypothetical protein
MRVLIVEPQKEPYEKVIENDLESMQKVVGGMIEGIYLEADVVLVDNEEGKLIPLEGNRRVGRDIIAGTFFICGCNDEGEFVSLTDEQASKYFNRFKEAEKYSSEQVEDAIFIELHVYSNDEYEEDDEI